MKAIHINWTKPFTNKTHMPYAAEDFDILTTIISALKWREINGEITLVTDSEGARFYESAKMSNIWDNIDVCLDDIKVNADVFWAAGKLFALKKQKSPVAMIDTDFIMWDKVNEKELKDVNVIHFEELAPHIYPPFDYFKNTDFKFDKDFDKTVKACNTAFCVFNDSELLKYYTDMAIDFMEKTTERDDRLCYMVFAEQRLLPICAKKLGKSVKAFSDMSSLFSGKETRFTHTWGMKQQMRDNDALRYDFCMRCIRRILNDYPHMEGVLKNIENLKKYF